MERRNKQDVLLANIVNETEPCKLQNKRDALILNLKIVEQTAETKT